MRSLPLITPLLRGLEALGARQVRALAVLGEQARLLVSGMGGMLSLGFRLRMALEQVYVQAVRSLGLILVSGFFVGMVLALQTSAELDRFKLGATVADLVCVALVRELGPVFTALLLAGRAGSGIAAELASMSITEQVSAMRMLGLSVHRLVVVPRILAGVVAAFSLTVVFNVVGIAGGYVIGVGHLGVPLPVYHARTLDALRFAVVANGLAKAAVFGLFIAAISCYAGLSARGGAKGVGRATTQAVVAASLAVLVSDFFLTRALMSVFG